MSGPSDESKDTSNLKRVEPGWLQRSAQEARRSIIRSKTPMELAAMGKDVTIPLRGKELADLFEDLNDHFYAWTAMSLRDFINKPTSRELLIKCRICNDTHVLLLPRDDALCEKLGRQVTKPCVKCDTEGYDKYRIAREELLNGSPLERPEGS